MEEIDMPFFNSFEMEQFTSEYHDEERMKMTLQEHGFVVVLNVLNDKELIEAEASLGKDLVEMLDAVENQGEAGSVYENLIKKPSHEVPKSFPHTPNFPCGGHGLPQGRFAWSLRLNQRVKNVFQLLYPEDELCCGMDQVFYAPYHLRASNRKVGHKWGHVDLNIHDKHDTIYASELKEWEIYQSIVSIWPSTEETSWSTVMWPGSHRTTFPQIMKNLESDPHFCDISQVLGHFVSLNDKDMNAKYLREARRVPLPPGSMLIWNSKTVHQGANSNQGMRLAMPICWEPKSRRSNGALNRKMLISASGLPSTHWASLGNYHGDRKTRKSTSVALNKDPKMIQLARRKSIKPVTILDDSTDALLEDDLRIMDMLKRLTSHDVGSGSQPSTIQYEELLNEDDAAFLRTLFKEEYLSVL